MLFNYKQMSNSTEESSSSEEVPETYQFTSDEYLDLIRRIVGKFQTELLEYTSITPEYIMSRFTHDVGLGQHLVRRYQRECSDYHHTTPQLAMFIMGIDGGCKRQLFGKVACDYDSTRLFNFFHWIVCMCAPYSIKEMFRSLNLSESDMDLIIFNWKNKDAIVFFYKLDKEKQEIIMSTYANYNHAYDSEVNYFEKQMIAHVLDM